jgi:hypothetical protein
MQFLAFRRLAKIIRGQYMSDKKTVIATLAGTYSAQLLFFFFLLSKYAEKKHQITNIIRVTLFGFTGIILIAAGIYQTKKVLRNNAIFWSPAFWATGALTISSYCLASAFLATLSLLKPPKYPDRTESDIGLIVSAVFGSIAALSFIKALREFRASPREVMGYLEDFQGVAQATFSEVSIIASPETPLASVRAITSASGPGLISGQVDYDMTADIEAQIATNLS